ncbi:MAG: histidine kinase dimerization/phospho-acceptor domain-containing protein, partial [Clostridiales bacterium]
MTQIKNKHYARSKLLLLAAKLFIFTAVFWLLVYFFDIIVNGFIANFLISIFGDIPALYFFYNNYQQLTALFYAGMMLLICFIDLYKTARGVISINQDIELLLDKNRQLNDLPDDLQATELALKEIKYAIERNEQAAREAEQRKNDLVVYLAHDLKTPLTSVIGYLTLLIESPDLPLAHRVKYMDITLKKAYRLEQLINEFFEITRYNLQSIVLEHNRLDLTLFLRQM